MEQVDLVPCLQGYCHVPVIRLYKVCVMTLPPTSFHPNTDHGIAPPPNRRVPGQKPCKTMRQRASSINRVGTLSFDHPTSTHGSEAIRRGELRCGGRKMRVWSCGMIVPMGGPDRPVSQTRTGRPSFALSKASLTFRLATSSIVRLSCGTVSAPESVFSTIAGSSMARCSLACCSASRSRGAISENCMVERTEDMLRISSSSSDSGL